MRLLFQIGLLFGLSLAGLLAARLLPFPFPGTMISLLLLLVLLLTRILKPEHIAESSGFLLKNMGFFFIPAGVGILGDLVRVEGKVGTLLLVVVATTVITFLTTALTVKAVVVLQERFGRRG